MKHNPQMSKTADHYINGQWINGQGENFISKNPADGSIIWRGHKATQEEIALACEAAHLALPYWSSLDLQTRTHYLQSFAKEIETKRQEIAFLIALETGKPLWEAQTEVSAVVSKVNLSIQAYHERNAEKEFSLPEANACLRYKPHGVAAVLGAFNFPAHLSNGTLFQLFWLVIPLSINPVNLPLPLRNSWCNAGMKAGYLMVFLIVCKGTVTAVKRFSLQMCKRFISQAAIRLEKKSINILATNLK